MAKIAFLGTGLLGSACAEAAAKRGETVTVWNRSADKARALVQYGISVAQTPAEAVRGAARVHLVLKDDAVVDDIIAAGTAFRTSGCPGRIAPDISACDRPFGDSPPSDIASYPFAPRPVDLRRIRTQLNRALPGEHYPPGDEVAEFDVD